MSDLRDFCQTYEITKTNLTDSNEENESQTQSFAQGLYNRIKQLFTFTSREGQYTIIPEESSGKNSKDNQANPPKTTQSLDDKIEELKRLTNAVCQQGKNKTSSRLGICSATSDAAAQYNTRLDAPLLHLSDIKINITGNKATTVSKSQINDSSFKKTIL